MRIDIATLFPDMCEAVLSESIVGRARKNGYIDIRCHNIRDYTKDKHRRVDDKPYGGGTGMLIQAQPVYDCVCEIKRQASQEKKTHSRLIYLSPQGKKPNQALIKELASEPHLIFLCGHYEGIDQRALEELEAEEISVGDYVVTGGELPALILTDAITRLQPGVLPNESAYSIESHYDGLLEYPQYTRPEEWRNRRVPDVLLSGHHENVKKWQKKMAQEITEAKRPDLLNTNERT